MMGKPQPAAPKNRHQPRWLATAKDDRRRRRKGRKECLQNAEEEQKKTISTGSNRPSGYSFGTALTPCRDPLSAIRYPLSAIR
jgi:hypothetical protein